MTDPAGRAEAQRSAVQVVFRADAGHGIGTGHVIRCLALADALREIGASCTFLHRDRSGHMAETIAARGHAVRLLPASSCTDDGWLATTTEQDLADTLASFRDLEPAWLVVDHYGLGADWEAEVRARVGRVMAIDDLADRAHACDLLADPNRGSNQAYAGLVPATCRVLTGPRYAPLGRAHRERRSQNRPRRGPARHVLVCYGRHDPHSEFARALRVLEQPAFRHLTVDAVAMTEDPRVADSPRPGLSVRRPQADLSELMASADLALGAGGTTSWERCAAGLPTVLTALAANQRGPAQLLDAAGAAVFAGMSGHVDDAQIAFHLSRLIDDTALFAAMSQRAWRVTDADGARRLAAALAPPAPDELSLRPVGADDRVLLYHWANDPDTRRNASDPRAIRWDEHVAWFARKMDAPGIVFDLLVTSCGLPVGQLRIEPEPDPDTADADAAGDGGGDPAAGVIHFAVEPSVRGCGYGRRLIELAVARWQRDGPGGTLLADVRGANAPSRRAFESNGFQLYGCREDGLLRYRRAPCGGRAL